MSRWTRWYSVSAWGCVYDGTRTSRVARERSTRSGATTAGAVPADTSAPPTAELRRLSIKLDLDAVEVERGDRLRLADRADLGFHLCALGGQAGQESGVEVDDARDRVGVAIIRRSRCWIR